MKRGFVVLLAAVMLISTLLCALPFATAAAEEFVSTGIIKEGQEYLLYHVGNIKDKGETSYDKCVLQSVQSADPHGLAYKNKPNAPYGNDCLWIFESAGGTDMYYMKSASTGKYLNMKPAGAGDKSGKGYASMESSKQALKVYASGSGYKISANLSGTDYWIRFTNSYSVSCWEAGAADGSNTFGLYTKGGADPEYKETGKPLFKVVTFGDPHVDYGIQSWATPIRQSSIDSAEYVRDVLGAADIALVAGDMASNNGGKTWTKSIFDKVQKTMFDTFGKATKDGKVLFVAGNHDNEAGINADDSWYSGDWSDIMEERNGKFTAELLFNDMGLGTSRFNEQICYRYTLKNMEFIGISPPYRPQRDSGMIYLKQIEWVENQLKSIGKDKTVILLCHYPLSGDAVAPEAPSNPGARAKLNQVLNAYPNVIYCYGHIHSGNYNFTWYSTSELVKPAGTAKRLPSNAYEVNSYITAHAGSMAYYKMMFQEDWLGAGEPGINQLLMMEFYLDHITFRYYNTGEKSAVSGVREIASYTVMRDMSAQLSGLVSSDSNSNSNSNPNTDPTTDSGSVTDSVDTTDSNPVSDTSSNGTVPSVTDTAAGSSSNLPSSGTADAAGNEGNGLPGWAIGVIVASGVVILGAAAFLVWFFVFKKK